MRTNFQYAQDIFNKKIILIAEDNAFLRQGYADVFTSLGCDVLTAANGAEAFLVAGNKL